jgi:F-box-like
MLSDVFAQIESRFDPGHSRTGIHDHSARAAAISTFDKGIDAAREFPRSMITRHNAFVPISLLPPEILARAFHLLILEEPPLPEEGRGLGWIKVTHVCQHWRQVALDDSSLWAKIRGTLRYGKWISEMLARAKNAPLDIELNVVRWSSREALLMLPPHLSRTRQFRLRVHSVPPRHSEGIREIFRWEAPALEYFELSATAYTNESITFRDLGGSMHFKEHTPRLRTFKLSRAAIPWSLIPRGQLTQLKLTSSDEEDAYQGDLNQFIDLLVNCPALEILTLESCLPLQLTEFPHGRTIHFSHLSRLRLCGQTSRIMNMLKMLKIPSSTKLHLDCFKIAPNQNDSKALILPVISAHFQSPVPVELKSLTVTITRPRLKSSLIITASTSPPTLRNRQTQDSEDDIVDNSELVLLFDGMSKPGHRSHLVEKACKMLPISNLEFVSMSASKIIDINWVKLFSCCTNVTTMRVFGHGTSSLVRALTAPTVTNAGSSNKGGNVQPASIVAHTHAAIFPKLKSLRLTRLNFDEREHPSGTLFNVLERGLQQRMAASWTPFKLLCISDCNISITDADDLQKLVQDFRWDENKRSINEFEYFSFYEQELHDEGFVDL